MESAATPTIEPPSAITKEGKKRQRDHRTFTTAQKNKMVAQAKKEIAKGVFHVTVAEKMDVHPTVLRRWMRGEGYGLKGKASKVKGVSISASGTKIYSDAFKRAAVKRYASGKERNKDICKDLNIHNSMLSNWVRALNAPLKKNKKDYRTVHKALTGASVSKFSEEDRRAIIVRVQNGEKITDLAKEVGVSPAAIDYWRNQLGMKTKKGSYLTAGAKTPGMSIPVRDAISFLRHARDEMHRQLQQGLIKEFDQAHLLSMMALNALLKI